MTTTTTTQVQPASCPDCGGPTRQAFHTTRDYVACRRCGHVHPAAAPVVGHDEGQHDDSNNGPQDSCAWCPAQEG